MSDAALNEKTETAIGLIDAAIIKLMKQIDSLKFAKTVLAGDHPDGSALKTFPPSMSSCTSPPHAPQPSATELPKLPKRPRCTKEAARERDEQIRKLVGEGVLTGKELADRLKSSLHQVYSALSRMGISLDEARKNWHSKEGALLKRATVFGFDFGDLVFVRLSQGPSPMYMRCNVVSLPGESGEFTVKDPDGINLTLNVRDKIAPFRDSTPTFGVASVERRKEPQLPSKDGPAQAPQAKPVTKDPESPKATEDNSKRSAPFGTSFDFSKQERTATVPELRAEAIKRQRGNSGKAVQFATTFVDGHAHVAVVDRMGYGTTIKDATGTVHRIMKWEVMDAVGVEHSERHMLTLSPPSS